MYEFIYVALAASSIVSKRSCRSGTPCVSFVGSKWCGTSSGSEVEHFGHSPFGFIKQQAASGATRGGIQLICVPNFTWSPVGSKGSKSFVEAVDTFVRDKGSKVFKVHEQEQQHQPEVRERPGD